MLYRSYLKRTIDCILALLSIILLSWLILAISIAVKLTSKGPVFFTQKRVGKDVSYFKILKYRTMYIETPNNIPTHMLEKPEQYITRVGRFLRKTSLDELPQLFNIVIGQMAFVGPRPALYNQVDLVKQRDLYGANQVRPGLTGLAQVSGRDELPISVKARLDGKYVEHITFMGDIKIILRTALSVITQKGVKEGKENKKQANEYDATIEYAATKEKIKD